MKYPFALLVPESVFWLSGAPFSARSSLQASGGASTPRHGRGRPGSGEAGPGRTHLPPPPPPPTDMAQTGRAAQPPTSRFRKVHVVPTARGARGKHVCSRPSAQRRGPVCPAVEGEEEDMSRLDMVPKHKEDTRGSDHVPWMRSALFLPPHFCSSRSFYSACPSQFPSPTHPWRPLQMPPSLGSVSRCPRVE